MKFSSPVSRTFFAALLCAISLSQSCARTPTPAEKRVAAELAQEEPVPPGRPMVEASKEILFEAESLSPEQKARLRALHARSRLVARSINEDLSKSRLVLLKNLVDPKSKDADIEVLKDRIVKLEQKRTQNFLSSLDQAKRILGRQDAVDERVYRAFLQDPNGYKVMQ